jgi:hypothetical protein
MSTKIYSLVWKNMMTPVKPKPKAPQKIWLCCNRGWRRQAIRSGFRDFKQLSAKGGEIVPEPIGIIPGITENVRA